MERSSSSREALVTPVRRSGRKRRAPQAWWQDFSHTYGEAQMGVSLTESHSSKSQDNTYSKAREELYANASRSDENDGADYGAIDLGVDNDEDDDEPMSNDNNEGMARHGGDEDDDDDSSFSADDDDKVTVDDDDKITADDAHENDGDDEPFGSGDEDWFITNHAEQYETEDASFGSSEEYRIATAFENEDGSSGSNDRDGYGRSDGGSDSEDNESFRSDDEDAVDEGDDEQLDESSGGVTETTTPVAPMLYVPLHGEDRAIGSRAKSRSLSAEDITLSTDNDSESKAHGGSTVELPVEKRAHPSSGKVEGRTSSSLPTVVVTPSSGSSGVVVPAFSSHCRDSVSIPDKTPEKNSCGGPRPFSGKARGKDTRTPRTRNLASRRGEGNPSYDGTHDKRHRRDHKDTRKARQEWTKRSEHIPEETQARPHKTQRVVASLDGRRSRKSFPRVQLQESFGTSKRQSQDTTPPISRKVTATGFAGDPRMQGKELSVTKAPRKRRFRPTSPVYSFNFRSPPGSKPPAAMNFSENRKGLVDGTSYARPGFLLAKRGTLKYNPVTVHRGTVKVAIAISYSSNDIGEMVILPHSATGPRRTTTGDEFYFVKKGSVDCDIGFARSTLSTGDYVCIPNGQDFEIRNTSASTCEFVFFTTRTVSVI